MSKSAGLILLMIAIFSLVGLYAFRDRIWVGLKGRSLNISDEAELRSTFDRWVEAGNPSGSRLSEFMQGRDPRISVDTETINLNGTNVQIRFTMTNLASGESGILMISNLKMLIKKRPDGSSVAVDYPY